MCYWIEIRCAKQNTSGCYSSNIINSPMELTRSDSIAAVNMTIIRLSAKARELDWKQTKDGWICPICFRGE